MNSTLQRSLILVGLTLACLVAFVWAMCVGLPGFGLDALLDWLTGGGNPLHQQIFWDLRLPRALLALLAGAGLALAGAGTQAVLANPLVSPSVLGLTSGAGFGAALVIMFGGSLYLSLGLPLLMAVAFAMSMLAVLLAYGLAAVKRASQETVILAGIAVSYIFSGAGIFLQYLAEYQDLRAIVFWTVGSLWSADFPAISVLLPIVLVCALTLLGLAPKLNSLILGEETALGVGVSVRRLRLGVLLLCSVLTAAIVSFTGAIGFVGLIGPHLARGLLGLDNRWLVPGSALCGALLLLLADAAARAIAWPAEIPTGVMTALVGGPFFLLQLLRRKKDWWL